MLWGVSLFIWFGEGGGDTGYGVVSCVVCSDVAVAVSVETGHGLFAEETEWFLEYCRRENVSIYFIPGREEGGCTIKRSMRFACHYCVYEKTEMDEKWEDVYLEGRKLHIIIIGKGKYKFVKESGSRCTCHHRQNSSDV